MTSNKIKSLISDECAGYNKTFSGIHHYCCHEPGETKQCIYFVEDNDQRCSRFESSVLPMELELEAIYHAQLKAQASGYELSRYQKKLIGDATKLEAVCLTCGKVFNPASRRQKNCEYCRKQKIREQARLRKQNQRIKA